MSRGGARPGSGRKPRADKKVQTTITITPLQLEDLKSLKARGIDTNKAIGREISRLATAFDLADAGIV